MRFLAAAVVLSSLVASCGPPDPFGVDCRTSPACQEREAKKQRQAQAAKQEACAAAGEVWLSNDELVARQAPAALQCDRARHACDGLHGCPGRSLCWSGDGDESPYCVDEGSSWDGHCMRCADRALMVEGKRRSDEQYRAESAADDRRVAAAEVASGACAAGTTGLAVLSDFEREAAGGLTRAEQGQVVATAGGVTIVVRPRPGKTYELLLVATQPLRLVGPPGARPVEGSTTTNWPPYQRARATVKGADGAAQTWTVTGQGCVSWSLAGG